MHQKNEYHQVNKTISVTDFGDGKKDSLDLDEDGKTDMYFLLAVPKQRISVKLALQVKPMFQEMRL